MLIEVGRTMKNKKDLDLLNGPITPLILKLTAPMMISTLIRNSYFFVDMAFASFLGGVQIASVAFVTPMFNTLNALGMGITNGGVGVIAKAIGEENYEKASEYAIQLRYIILILAGVISVLGAVFSTSIIEIMGIEGELLTESITYSKIVFFTIPFSLISSIYATLFQSQGKMNIQTIMTAITFTGNTALNALFVLVFKRGIEGLAYASLITQVVQTLIVYGMYYREKHQFSLPARIFASKMKLPIIKDLLKMGLPLSFSQSSSSFGFMLCNIFVARYGYEVVAAYAIGNRINTFFYGPAMGFGRGTVPLVAQNLGNRNLARIKEIANKNMLYSFIFGIVGAFGLMLIMPPLNRFLSKDNLVIMEHVRNYTRLMSWAMIPWSLFQCMSGIFNGLQKTALTMSITMVRLWVLRIPGIALFYYVLPSFAEYGVWYTMFFSNVFTAVFALACFFIYIPRHIYPNIEADSIPSS